MVSYRDFMAKHAQVAMRIARDLFRARPGDRLPPVADYAAQLGVGRGTVQTALRLLQDSGAVRLIPRGHMGTFVESIDPSTLWELTGLGTVTGVMPLPYSLRYKGLATGLYRAFQQAEIPLVLAHIRGARRRLAALDSGRYEFALVSRFSFEVAQAETGHLEIAVPLGPQSGVREHVLLLRGTRGGRIEDGMRVGIDPESIDVTALTLRECGTAKVTLVELPYLQFPDQMLKGTIDAAMWDSEEGLPDIPGVRVVPLRDGDLGPPPETGEAVLVTRKDNQAVGALLREKIDPGLVRSTQERVMRGEELPEL
ncbi:MAG: GntR family transcriptional regulator YhfZ [Bacillota bacterium]|jgi:hypothetical protein